MSMIVLKRAHSNRHGINMLSTLVPISCPCNELDTRCLQAHNLKVAGSNPATHFKRRQLLFRQSRLVVRSRSAVDLPARFTMKEARSRCQQRAKARYLHKRA